MIVLPACPIYYLYFSLKFTYISSQVKGCALILQLARNPDNLEELFQNGKSFGNLKQFEQMPAYDFEVKVS